MNKYYWILPIFIFCIGCAALLSEQKYVLIDAPVTKERIIVGRIPLTVYSIPEQKPIRKIRIFGEGRVRNVKIYALQHGAFRRWKLVKDIKGELIFPHDVSMIAQTDSIAIAKTLAVTPTKKGRELSGKIHRLEFYTVSLESQ